MTQKKLKISALLSFLSVFANFGYQLLLTPLLTRKLGSGVFGVYSICSSIMAYIMLLWAGISSAYSKFYFDYQRDGDGGKVKRLNGLVTIIIGSICLGTVVGGFLLSRYPHIVFGTLLTEEELNLGAKLLMIISLSGSFTLMSCVFELSAWVKERFIFIRSLQTLRYFLLCAVTVAVLLSGCGAMAVMLGQAAVIFGCMVANYYYSRLSLDTRYEFRAIEKQMVKSVLYFSLFIGLQSLLEILNAQFDKILVVHFQGASAAGVYTVGTQLYNAVFVLGTTLTGLFIPKVNRIVSGNQTDADTVLSETLSKVGRIQFLGVALLYSGIVFFGKPFVRFFAGGGYDGAYIVGLILILPLLMTSALDLGQYVVRAKSRHHILVLMYLGSSIVFLIIRIPLCASFGIIGAAVGTTAGIVAAQIIIAIIYMGRCGLNMKVWFSQIIRILPSLVIPIIVGAGIMLFADISRPIPFLAYGVMYIVIFGISVWMFGLNAREKDIFAKPIRKLIGRIR